MGTRFAICGSTHTGGVAVMASRSGLAMHRGLRVRPGPPGGPARSCSADVGWQARPGPRRSPPAASSLASQDRLPLWSRCPHVPAPMLAIGLARRFVVANISMEHKGSRDEHLIPSEGIGVNAMALAARSSTRPGPGPGSRAVEWVGRERALSWQLIASKRANRIAYHPLIKERGPHGKRWG